MQASEANQGGAWNAHPSQPASTEDVKTLWMGDLQYWMDENYLWSIFAPTGEVIRDNFFSLAFNDCFLSF